MVLDDVDSNQGQEASRSQHVSIRALLDQGIAAAKRGQYERARRRFEAVLAMDHDNEEAWLGLASLTGDRDLARAIYQRVLEAHPDSVRARTALRWLEEATSHVQPFVSKPEEPGTEPKTAQTEEVGREERRQEPSQPPAELEGPALFVPPWETGAVIPIMESPSFGATIPEPLITTTQGASEISPSEAASPEVAREGEEISPCPSHAVSGVGGEAELPAMSDVVGSAAMPQPEELAASPETSPEASLPTEGGVSPAEEKPIPEESTLTNMPYETLDQPEAIQPPIEARAAFRPPNRGGLERRSGGAQWRVLRDVAMLLMLGIVLLGASGLAFLVADESRADKVRIALGAMTLTPTPTLTPTYTPTPTSTSTSTPTRTPTVTLTPLPTGTFTPSPTLTPSWVTARFLPLPLEEKWIEVDLSEQRLTAYEGTEVVFSTKISSGRSRTPTITGKFRIQRKYESQLMSGPGYYLPAVPYVMYFYGNYALHGAYWHNNWGTPMSHGCVNLRKEDAKWLYEWTGPVVPANAKSVTATRENPGTWVIIHE